MLTYSYFYYGYITGYSLWTAYSYWESVKTAYNVYNNVRHYIKPPKTIETIEMDDWDICDDIKSF